MVEASLPNAFLGNNDTKIYFFIGWVILLSYVPFYWYRVKVEDPKYAAEADHGRSRRRRATERSRATRVGAMLRQASPPPEPRTARGPAG